MYVHSWELANISWRLGSHRGCTSTGQLSLMALSLVWLLPASQPGHAELAGSNLLVQGTQLVFRLKVMLMFCLRDIKTRHNFF